MQARAEFRGPAFSQKMVWAIVALAAAALLGGGGAYAINATRATVAPAAHAVQGMDVTGGTGSAWNYSTRRSGSQSLEGPASYDAAGVSAGTRLGGSKFVD